MKKLLAVILAMLMLLSFGACSNSSSEKDDEKDSISDELKEKDDKETDEEEKTEKKNKKDDEDEDEDAELNGSSKIKFGSKTIQLPCTLGELLKKGFTLNESSDDKLSTLLPYQAYGPMYIYTEDRDNNGYIRADLANFTDKEVNLEKATVISLEFEEITEPQVSVGGFAIGSATKDEIAEVGIAKEYYDEIFFAGTALSNIEFEVDDFSGLLTTFTVTYINAEEFEKLDAEKNAEDSVDAQAAYVLLKNFGIDVEDFESTSEKVDYKKSVKIGDSVISIGDSYEDLVADGWKIADSTDEDYTVRKNTYIEVEMENENDEIVCIGFAGSNEEDVPLNESYVYCITVCNANSGIEEFEDYAAFETNGLTPDTKVDEFIDDWGSPYTKSANALSSYYSRFDVNFTYTNEDYDDIEVIFNALSGDIVKVFIS